MLLSIIIVNWNTRDLLKQCLDSIYANPPQGKFEIIVVDNASSDGSAEMVQRTYPYVRLIHNDENAGFARANNQAIRQAGGEYLLLLNPDTLIRPRAITSSIEFIEKHPKAGVVGVKLLDGEGKLSYSCHPFPTLFREFWRLFHLDKLYPVSQYKRNFWQSTEPREVDCVQGAYMLLRKSGLDEVGILDEDYFIYTEEVDLCYRLRKKGWKIYWLPQAEVVHYEGQSTKQRAVEMFLALNKSKVQFFRKHYGMLAVWGYKLILALASVVRIMASLIPWWGSKFGGQWQRDLRVRYCALVKSLAGF